MANSIAQESPRPFPFWPSTPTDRMLIRMELMNDLNKWDNNDPLIAKRMAAALVEVLENQFQLGERIPGQIQDCGIIISDEIPPHDQRIPEN